MKTRKEKYRVNGEAWESGLKTRGPSFTSKKEAFHYADFLLRQGAREVRIESPIIRGNKT